MHTQIRDGVYSSNDRIILQQQNNIVLSHRNIKPNYIKLKKKKL